MARIGPSRRRVGVIVGACLVIVLGIVLLRAAEPISSGPLRSAVLVVSDWAPGGLAPASATGGGKLGLARNGCVTVGGAYLVAPRGSEIVGDRVRIAGLGSFAIGDHVPGVRGVTGDLRTPAHNPALFARCGPGVYETFLPA